MERFHAMSDKVQFRAAVVADIKDGLQEEKEKYGAYFCTYPGFTDCYHIVCRMLERNGQAAFLMLCTMVDREGQPLTDENKLEKYMEKLKQAIGSSLRRGDFYTRYGANQFLILLIGLHLEDSSVIQNKMCIRDSNSNFSLRKLQGSGVKTGVFFSCRIGCGML